MRFRRVDSMFWNDRKVRGLSDDGKLAFLFVLTHPNLTALGAMRATLNGLAAELGWPSRRLRTALEPAITSGMLDVDANAAFIGLPNFLKFNTPQVRNHFRAWPAALQLLPECEGKQRLLNRCRARLATIPDTMRDAIPDVIGYVMRDAMPDDMGNGIPHDMPHGFHHGDGEGDGDGINTPKPPHARASHEAVSWLELLNAQAKTSFKPTDPNLRPIRARLRDGYTFAQAQAVVCAKVAEWRGTDYAKYLRPATVFGPKFDGYWQASNGRPQHANLSEDDAEE
jgi:uncharacterized phage protein (TIGR02220 family)